MKYRLQRMPASKLNNEPDITENLVEKIGDLKLESQGEKKEGNGKELTVAEGFQVNILDLLNLCINIVNNIIKAGIEPPCSVAILNIAYDYIKARDPDSIITSFIDSSSQAWDLFHTKDEKVLFSNIHALFPGIPAAQLDSVTKIFSMKDKKGQPIVTESDREAIWDFVEGFIGLSIYYIHQNRAPVPKEGGGIRYTKVFYKAIKVGEYASKFKIDLGNSN